MRCVLGSTYFHTKNQNTAIRLIRKIKDIMFVSINTFYPILPWNVKHNYPILTNKTPLEISKSNLIADHSTFELKVERLLSACLVGRIFSLCYDSRSDRQRIIKNFITACNCTNLSLMSKLDIYELLYQY